MKYTVQTLYPFAVKNNLKETGINYLRFGAILPHEGDGWNRDFMEEITQACLDRGIIPQLTFPIASLTDHERKYRDEVRELLEKYKQSEAVFASWGQLSFPITNNKIASHYLNVSNAEELNFLRESGVSVVTIPENLGDEALELLQKKVPSGIFLEYHQRGELPHFFGWGDKLPDLPFHLRSRRDWPIKPCKRTIHAKPVKNRKLPENIGRWLITVLSEKDWRSFSVKP